MKASDTGLGFRPFVKSLFILTLVSLVIANSDGALHSLRHKRHHHALVKARRNEGAYLMRRDDSNTFPTGWTFLGCYTDNVAGNRVLTASSFTNTTSMTQELCANFCNGQGFALAGLEYMQECYCGNWILNGGAPATETDCDLACVGNQNELCGGPNRLSVFQSPISPGPPPTPPVEVPSFGNFTSLGCYSDNVNGGRALTFQANVPAENMTIENCAAACVAAEFPLSGAEFSTQCYCGYSFENGGALVNNGCTMTCQGNVSEFCGGPNRLSVYNYTGSLPPPPPVPVEVPTVGNWTSIGCYSEGTTGRTLPIAANVPGNNMTIENCQAACLALGYNLAGTEFATQCFCGLSFTLGGVSVDDGGCNMACSGNDAELCGGPNRLSSYNYTGVITTPPQAPGGGAPAGGPPPPPVTKGLPEPWQYLGCYTEGQGNRALTTQAADNTSLVVVGCIEYCESQNFTIAGMEFSIQCFCGDFMQDAPAVAPAADCNMGCGGNASQACGAGDRLSVYATTPTIEIFPIPTAVTANLPGDWVFQGCFQEPDFPAPRVFPYETQLNNNMTVPLCVNLCQTYGYPAAGLEYGSQCFCGDIADVNASSPGLAPLTDCSIPCPGDPTTLCGAGNRLSTYFWTGTPLFEWHTPDVIGRYEFLVGGPVVPLITALMRNDKVTFLEKLGSGPPNSTHAYELDYTLASNAELAFRTMHVQTDVFCSGGVILPDKVGRQLNVGGWSLDSTFGVRLYWPDGSLGVNGTNDWEENWWELSLQIGRWYPGSLVLSNGSVLVVGGERGANDIPEPTMEILPRIPGGNTTVYQQFLQDTDPFNLYPFLWVLPSGNIYISVYNTARILEPVGFQTVSILPTIPGAVNQVAGRTYPMQGATVMLPMFAPYTEPAQMLTCGGSPGGGAQTLDNCVLTTPEAENPEWTIERMPFRRVMPNFVALPDGTFMIVNGAGQGIAGFGLADDPTLTALLYDPTLPIGSRISILNTTIVARMYHSEAILMHDTRVLISGSDPLTTTLFPNGTVNPELSFPEEYRVEVYYPPYLVTGNKQPTYTITNTDWAYSGQYSITVQLFQGTISTMRISLLGAVVSTHGNNFGQRVLFPEYTCAGFTCTITAPPNNKISPPGWFQLFVLDGPTPSFSQWVRIGGDPAELGNWPNFPDFTVPGV